MVQILSNDQIIYTNEDLINIAKGRILWQCEREWGIDFLENPSKREQVKQVLTSLQNRGYFKQPLKAACALILEELNKKEN